MRLAILFLILVFLVDLLGFYIGSYRFYFYDIVLHFFGGFFVAMFFYGYLKEYMTGRKIKKLLIIVGATVFIGVFWEFSEYLATVFLGDYLYNNYGITCCMGDLNDTVNDLAMDILGAIIYTTITLFSFICRPIKDRDIADT